MHEIDRKYHFTDLAVGSVVALIGACAGTFIVTWKMNIYLAVAMCMMVGLLIGMWQGFWIAYVRIPAFIVTLSGMLVFRGLTLLILSKVGYSRMRGIPLQDWPCPLKLFAGHNYPSIYIYHISLFGHLRLMVHQFVGATRGSNETLTEILCACPQSPGKRIRRQASFRRGVGRSGRLDCSEPVSRFTRLHCWA